MYSKIIDPTTGKRVSLLFLSKQGMKLLSFYSNNIREGPSLLCYEFHEINM